MILLAGITDLIQVVTGSAVVSIPVHASWVDLSGTTVTPSRLNTSITTAATTTVVTSPAASTQRNLKFLSIRNVHATSSNDITVQHTDGTTVVVLIKVTLLAGYSLVYNDVSGWELLDTNGALVTAVAPAAGSLIAVTQVSTASANFTTGAKTRFVRIRGVGGGGGGGGCTSVAAAASAAGGGGGGAYCEKFVGVSPSTAYAYTSGAGGTGVSAAAGNAGANSTFVIAGVTYTAPGGAGGPLLATSAALTSRLGGAGGVVATNGDVNLVGKSGEGGVVLIVATPVVLSGQGADSQYGVGGQGLVAVGNGLNGSGFGAGGSGSATGASVARTGGNGTGGCWVIEEYS